MTTQWSTARATRRAYMRRLGRRGGLTTYRTYGRDHMRAIGRAGYVAAIAAGWTDYVRTRLEAWKRRYDGAWWEVAGPEWRSPTELLDVVREGLCAWSSCERPGRITIGQSRVCWEHYQAARREREAAGIVYSCFACGHSTPTDDLGGLVAGRELCARCSQSTRLRAYWLEAA